MDYLTGLLQNKILLSAAIGWAFAQVIKTIIDFAFNKKVNFERLVGSGGMPSCHSATVCALATSSAITCGTASSEFALSCILAIIVMYDARGVRRETGTQAVVLNQIIEFFKRPDNVEKFKFEFDHKRLKELVGHTPLQVTCGGLTGIAVAIIVCNFIL